MFRKISTIKNNQIFCLWNLLIRKRKIQITLLLVFMLLTSIAEILSLSALVPFITAISSPEILNSYKYFIYITRLFNCVNHNEILILISAIFICATIIASLLRVLLLVFQTKLSFSIGNDLSQKIYGYTLNKPYLEHISKNSSEVISGIINKSSMIVNGVILPILTIISSALILISLLFVLFYIDFNTTFLTLLVFGILYFLILRFTKKRLNDLSISINKEEVQVIRSLQEGLGGIRDVILHGSQNFYKNIFSISNNSLQNARSSVQIISGVPKYIIEGFGMIFIALIALTLTLQTKGTSNSLAVVGTLALGAQKLLPLLQIIFSSITSIRSAESSLTEILYLLKEDILPLNNIKNVKNRISFSSKIKLCNVSFRYNSKSKIVLKNTNIEINKGEIVGIIGKTGSGKSTLLDIIMGLIEPEFGGLFIDEVLVDKSNTRSWQEQISHVPQSIYLSDSSILSNIAFGIPTLDIDINRVKLAAKMANISELIDSWELGYMTNVGERGINLSGGQRQRIGLARAFYKESSVVIFDEATSALDNETEQNVMDAVYNLSKYMTIIIVAHRHSTLNKCDKIFEIKDATIITSKINLQ
jgi:ABC-type multidrug transport system fused ATPase/permease subunit